MNEFGTPTRRVAVVEEVLPKLGLAYATDDEGRCWTVTKSMAGTGIGTLQPGQRLTITVTELDRYTVASAYAPLD